MVRMLTALLLGFMASLVQSAPPDEIVPLVRFYNHKTNEHAYAHEVREINQWRGVSTVTEHYPIGLVATKQLPGTVALVRVVRKADQRHFYAVGNLSQSTLYYTDKVNFHAYVWDSPGDGRIPIYASTWTDKSDVFLDADLTNVDKFSEDTKRNLNVDRLRPAAGPLFYVYPLPGSAAPVTPTPQVADASERFLDDMRELSYLTSHGGLGRHGATGFPNFDVQQVRLKATPDAIQHALSFTPQGSESDKRRQKSYVRYAINGAFTTFRATAALNYPVQNDGLEFASKNNWNGQSASPITFRVVGDGKSLWESLPLQKHGEVQDCEVSVAGIKTLTLEVECSGSQVFAWSFWANPRLVLAEGAQDQAPALEQVASSSAKAPMAQPVKPSLADIIEATERSVVRIDAETANGKVQGSGFLIQPGIIATNVHVLAGATSANVVLANDQIFRIEGTLHTDTERDIAIAKLSSPAALELPILPLAAALPRKGEHVVALGSPMGLAFTATTGVVSAVRQAAEITKEVGRDLAGTWVQVDAALSSGNSGGPIINDNGEVVAMSTLASKTAQNLNFGISAGDIRQALEIAGSRTVSQLSEIARMPGNSPQIPRDNGYNGERVSIPDAAVVAYIERARTEFADLKQSLSREMGSLRNLIKEMRAGEIAIPRNLDSQGADVVYEVNGNRKGERKWYFRSDKIKQKEIDSLDARLRELAKLAQVSTPDDATTLAALLWKFGPKIETRNNNSVGFLDGATVVKVLNGHDVLIDYNDIPYLISLETTVGLWSGHQLEPLPVYVNGTVTAASVVGNTSTVTRLQSMNKQHLDGLVAQAVKSSVDPAPSKTPTSRIWRDKSGKFAIEATLLEVTATEVVLRRADGKVVRVPRDKLCDEDQKYLQ